MIILFFNLHNQLYVFFPDEEFQYIDPADEEMDDGFVFSPVSVFLHHWSCFQWNLFLEAENCLNCSIAFI